MAATGIGLVLCIFLFRIKTFVIIILVLLNGVCAGLWRGSDFSKSLVVYQPLFSQKMTLRASVVNDGNYNKSKQMSFVVTNVQTLDGLSLPGKLSVSGFGLNSVYVGDELLITGKLKPTLGANQGRMSFAQLELIKHNPSMIGDVRRGFAVGLQNALPEPVASFALGLLVGQRATLPEDVKVALLHVGLTHIIAVSGYNLTIILRASKRLMANRSKRISTGLSISLIVIFLLITGFSASIVRAAVISGLSIYASYYGRTVESVLLILLVAAGTALYNPVYLWSDAGWHLSFLAFTGVIILAPLIAQRLPTWVQQSTIMLIAIESFAAGLMATPYLLHTFGQTSFIGLFANVLIVAFIPLAMLLSAAAGIVGLILPSLVGWIAWPATLVLGYILNTAQLLSQLPHVFREGIYISQSTAIQLYGLLFFVWLALHFNNPTKDGIITDKTTLNRPEHERMHIV
jgi:competence protein ComEC